MRSIENRFPKIQKKNKNKTIKQRPPLDRLIIEVENVFVSNDQNFGLQSVLSYLLGWWRSHFVLILLRTRVKRQHTPTVECKTKISLATVESFKRNAMCDYSAEKEKRFNLSAFYLSSAWFAFLFSFSSKKESTLSMTHIYVRCSRFSFVFCTLIRCVFFLCKSSVPHGALYVCFFF